MPRLGDIWPELMWWAVLLLLLAVIAVMARRRYYREFPFMFAYALVVCASEIVRHVVMNQASVIKYFYVYWITEAFMVAISFAVLYEVYLLRLFPSFYTRPIYRYLFPIAGLAIAALTALAYFSLPNHGPATVPSVVARASLVLNFVQVAAFIFFFAVSLVLDAGWQEQEFGVVLGFGLHATVKLLMTLAWVRANYGHTPIEQLPVYSYAAALVIWLIYFSRKRPNINVRIGPELFTYLATWDAGLRRILRKNRVLK